MTYIYCECFSPIFWALYLRDKGENEITIITINKNVEKFCLHISMKCIYFDRIPLSLSQYYNLKKFKRNIKSILELIKIKENEAFYILDNVCLLEGFYFSHLLKNKKNVIYFKSIEINELYKSPRINKKYIVAKLDLLFYKIFLKIDLVLKKINNKPVIGIDKSFLVKNKISVSEENKSFNEIKIEAIKRNKINFGSIDTLFVDGGSSETSCYFKPNHLKNVIVLLRKYSKKIMIKEHPNFKWDAYVFKGFKKIPDFIPAELILSGINKNVISTLSTTLISSAKFEQLKTISLLDIIEWENNSLKYKETIKQKLIKESDNNIIFVKTLAELEKLIKT